MMLPSSIYSTLAILIAFSRRPSTASCVVAATVSDITAILRRIFADGAASDAEPSPAPVSGVSSTCIPESSSGIGLFCLCCPLPLAVHDADFTSTVPKASHPHCCLLPTHRGLQSSWSSHGSHLTALGWSLPPFSRHGCSLPMMFCRNSSPGVRYCRTSELISFLFSFVIHSRLLRWCFRHCSSSDSLYLRTSGFVSPFTLRRPFLTHLPSNFAVPAYLQLQRCFASVSSQLQSLLLLHIFFSGLKQVGSARLSTPVVLPTLLLHFRLPSVVWRSTQLPVQVPRSTPRFFDPDALRLLELF